MTDTRHTALQGLHALFLQLGDQIDTIPREAGRERVIAQYLALAHAIELYAKEVEHDIDTKDRVNKVILALVTKHWKGYTGQPNTIAQQAKAGAQMDQLIVEFERALGQENAHYPHYDFASVAKAIT